MHSLRDSDDLFYAAKNHLRERLGKTNNEEIKFIMNVYDELRNQVSAGLNTDIAVEKFNLKVKEFQDDETN